MVRLEDDDFDDFMGRVTDVGQLPINPMTFCGRVLIFYSIFFGAEKTIKDLIAGKIAVDEVDKKEAELLEKQRLTEERKALKKAAEEKRFKKLKTAQERKQWGFIGR